MNQAKGVAHNSVRCLRLKKKTESVLLSSLSPTLSCLEHSVYVLRRPGIEPGSAVWDTTMLATTPPALPASCRLNASKVQPNAAAVASCLPSGWGGVAWEVQQRIRSESSLAVARTAASTALMRSGQ